MRTYICYSLIITMVTCFTPDQVNGQWSASGTDIYNNNSGNVGIGTNSPPTLLYVSRNMTEPTITVRNLSGFGGATFTMLDDASGANWKFKATLNGGFKIRDNANGLDVIVFEPNSFANAIYLRNNGSFGIGTATPSGSALVHLSSNVKGFLPPRMTQAEISNIVNPANGLMVFNTTTEKINIYKASASAWEENAFGTATIIPLPIYYCGSPLIINHVAGSVAPVNKTVAYGTVLTSLSGSNKCWITQNLGSDQQATAPNDASEPSAGWYWQFNRPQGYKHDGITVTPAWTITNISENSSWLSSNDPCSIELGSNWRIPTRTEWTNVIANGGWAGWDGPWNSVLKMHASGDIDMNGLLNWRGSFGDYWSGTQDNSSLAWLLELGYNINCTMFNYDKYYGFTIRCIEEPPVPPTFCATSITVNHIAGNVAPVTKTVTYGIATNITGEPAKCWITSNLGATNQAVSVSDATEPSAGWYWQFNRQQGYKHDGVTRTPNTAWITTINETTNWLLTNDPCAIELGSGWRIPTYTEWLTVDAAGSWTNWNGPWNALNMHAAGILSNVDGSLQNRGSSGYYWSSYHSNPNAWALYFTSGNSDMANMAKSFGMNLRCVQVPTSTFSCGSVITINHQAGSVAPVTKTVNYATVTNIPGEPLKCWISSNLGADNQATAVNDATEPSAGWYWQFNRMQGYKHDGITRTPNTTWIYTINENSIWTSANDPCTIELGTGWRLPSATELLNIDAGGGWNDWNGPWSSALKLHAAGLLTNVLQGRGSFGYAWSSSQLLSNNGYSLAFDVSNSLLFTYDKATAFTVRCVQ